MERSRALRFWPVLLLVTAADATTKALAQRLLPLPQLPHPVLGSSVRLTLVYNPGAAFGISLGAHSRWIFLGLTLVALVILARLYAATRPDQRLRTVALALVCGGALGNLIDRVWSPLGVVDFIDIGVGTSRWPTFNVADIAVTMGAVLLAVVLWSEDRQPSVSSIPVIDAPVHDIS